MAAFGLAVILGSAPPPAPTQADELQAYIQANAQTATVRGAGAATSAERDGFTATPGIQTLVAGGTNHDWAKLVLLLAGFPMSDDNVTVMLRWMRQENGADSWYTRNNPLNIGSGGFASYGSLTDSAGVVARALTSYSGYSGIRDAFQRSAPTAEIEYAIWSSPWAGGHYAWGGHWHYTPVDVVKAPSSAW